MKAWTVISLNQKGYDVLSGQGHRALLPLTELSDMPGIARIVSQSIADGTVLEDLVCVSDDCQPYVSFAADILSPLRLFCWVCSIF